MSALSRRAFPVVLAAPSGTGKTTIAHTLVNGPGNFVFSVSATTRPPRGDEQGGKAYHFMDEPSFERMIAQGEFVEWARVHGNLYGTPRRNLEEAAERGEYVVLDIDVQGARQLRESVPDAVLIFIFPPSARALAQRLMGRATDPSAEVRRRLLAAGGEIQRALDFDYVVVNEDLSVAVEQVREIVRTESLRPGRVRDFGAEVERLQGEIESIVTG